MSSRQNPGYDNGNYHTAEPFSSDRLPLDTVACNPAVLYESYMLVLSLGVKMLFLRSYFPGRRGQPGRVSAAAAGSGGTCTRCL